MARPLQDNSARIPASQIGAYAPPQEVPEAPPEPEPLQGGTAISVPAVSCMAYAPAQENARPQTIPDIRRPVGECAHPFALRLYNETIDIEGCRRCGLACVAGKWEANDEWAAWARKLGAIQ